MSVARNQARIARDLWRRLLPLDRNSPLRLQALLADRRFGSRDRRLYRELLLTAIRHARALSALEAQDDDTWAAHLARACAGNKDTILFRNEFNPAAESPSHTALDLVPDWFAAECDTGLPPAQVAAALLARAPLWVRLQSPDPDAVFAEWAALGLAPAPHPALPDALRFPPETNLSATLAYQAGHYEIQDLGSQLILATLDLAPSASAPSAARPPARWLDACAGAGGKSLQLARLLGPSAQVEASDIRPAALAELRTRAARAGVRNLHTVTRPEGLYDGVLVDAPCSGSGTWRRSPHLMACTTLADLDAAAALQSRLLADFARFVRPGGLLVYATCSVARRENRAVASAFLAAAGDEFTSLPPAKDFGFPALPAHPANPAAPVPGLALAPGLHDNDGFYVAAFRRLQTATAPL